MVQFGCGLVAALVDVFGFVVIFTETSRPRACCVGCDVVGWVEFPNLKPR